MPFKSSDAKTHTKKAKTAKQRRQWASVANSTRKSCLADGKSEKACDARGIKAANAVIAKGVEEMDPENESPIVGVEQAPDADADLKEGYYVDGPEMYSSATSFADLEAERETKETVADLHRTTADLMMMVDNVMWRNEIEPKIPALQGLFDEYLAVVRETLDEGPGDEAPEETEPGLAELETDAIDLAEQSALISVSEATIEDLEPFSALLAEKHVELSDPRRAPVLVNFAIIKPGPGNTKDNNYYPAETLSGAAPLFSGTDIYLTDHKPNEKNERNKVGCFLDGAALAEQGLVSQAIIYDADQAEKTRNRADAGKLGTLHCSITATGKGRPGTIDGHEYTVIESFTEVHSVDLVSRAGAGGRAISLAENVGGTMDPETQKENEKEDLAEKKPEAQEAVEVAIVESDAEPEEAPEPEPQVEAARVIELLAESDLDGSAHKWVLGQIYDDEAGVGQAIDEMRTFIADLTPAGQVFGLGETAVAITTDVPKILTAEEQGARLREHTRTVMERIDPTYAGNL